MKIAVLLSGGVDSSVALSLLAKERVHELTAYYLKIWLEDELASLGECPWEEDLKFARSVCETWGVPLQIVPLQSAYWERVVQYAITELKAGHTPSPDIFCNQRIKYGAFLDAVGESYDKVASGHYARVRQLDDGSYALERAIDEFKDQSYFLSHLSQQQLAKALFPIGGMEKQTVRAIGKELGLATAERPDSQGICFLGKIKFNDFVRFHLGDQPGDIVEAESGRTLGQHKGLWFHTIGQRKGLGLGGGPWFVVGKDLDANRLLVSHADLLEQHARAQFDVTDMHWISGRAPERFDDLTVKIRHGRKRYKCHIDPQTLIQQRTSVSLSEQDAGIAPGQFAIFYDGSICLGGGMIC